MNSEPMTTVAFEGRCSIQRGKRSRTLTGQSTQVPKRSVKW